MNILGYLKTFFLALFGLVKANVLSYLKDFAKNQLGVLATDAVQFAEAALPNAGGAEKLAAAKEKFLTDATAAGIDLSKFGASMVNFLLESALQKVLADASKGFASIA